MKSLSRFLLFALALISVGAHASPVATTAGGNLTAYNSGMGATNNNNWNTLTNPRGVAGTAPAADFGNCNALILRCAQPKCKSGGCTDMAVTSAIVSGCVNSNATCKQYGQPLIDYISAQMVAQSTATANQAAAAAQNAAAQQNNQQMAQMAETISALQQQITESNASMQAALQAQQESIATQIATAATPTPAPASSGAASASATASASDSASDSGELTVAQRIAAESGVPEDLVLRADISGQILTQMENAEDNLKTLKATMDTVFTYAGCDSRGDNCSGPKRVKKFKDLALEFFDPYQAVLDDLYEAIIMAQNVGVDVSNIYMMLNNSCERWAKYVCVNPMLTTTVNGQNYNVWPRYNEKNCDKTTGKSIVGGMYDGPDRQDVGSVKGNQDCHIGQTIPPEDDTSCTMIEPLTGDAEDTVARIWLFPEEGEYGDMVRVGCASNVLKNSWLFSGREQQASINLSTLKRIIDQDSLQTGSSRRYKNDLGQREQLKYCALTESGYMNLQKYVGLRSLPSRDICINDRKLDSNMDRTYIGESDSIIDMARDACLSKKGAPQFSEPLFTCFCYKSDPNVTGRYVAATGSDEDNKCEEGASIAERSDAEERVCNQFGVEYYNGVCRCDDAPYPEDRALCNTRFSRRNKAGTPSLITYDFNVASALKKNIGKEYDDCNGVKYNKNCCLCLGGSVIQKPRIGSGYGCSEGCD